MIDSTVLRAMSLEFFFSSRRRHTRCGRDWSSGVCSSDLRAGVVGGSGQAGVAIEAFQHAGEVIDAATNVVLRSEERRVGKECRIRTSPYPIKIKIGEILILLSALDECGTRACVHK